MKQKTIAILFGGMSDEYPVSLQSAHAVITHLDTARYNPVLVGITREGQWLRFRGDAGRIAADTWWHPECSTPAFISPCRRNAGLVEYGKGATVFTRLDAAFPILHGPFGEDGTVQGLLALAGIPVVGCGVLASAVCMDKDVAHRLAAQGGVAVPKSCVFTATSPFGAVATAAAALGYPLFVKPVHAGSSFGISRVADAQDLAAAVQTALRYDTHILLEEAVLGFEVGCAMMGSSSALTIGEVDEVELASGFFDYAEKYTLATSRIHVPARVSAEKTAAIKETAAAVYRLLGCSGFARVDFFVTPAGEIVFNEVNTIPGFTAHSRYPTMMQAAGLAFGAVVNRLIAEAIAP